MVIFQFAMLSYQRVSFLMIYLLMTNFSMAMLQDVWLSSFVGQAHLNLMLFLRIIHQRVIQQVYFTVRIYYWL